ncbi:hypothetical protein EV401DRAFT_1990766 [Pisolithus croceorrhizus]|nr:hypothetical protein EV401DRAFT_1990766 [Pisolithus croceorrhizus]
MVTLLAIVISGLKTPPIISSPYRRAFETLPHYSPFFWVPAIIIEPILCALVLRKARGLLRARTGLSALLARGSLVFFADLLSILVPWLIDPLNTVFLPFRVSLPNGWVIAFPSLLGYRLLLTWRRGDVEMLTYLVTQGQAGDAVPDDSNAPAVTRSASRV